MQPRFRGYSGLVVYADDFVVTFQYKDDAERFYEHLKKRMEYFGMTLEENKTRLIEFARRGRKMRQKRQKTADCLRFWVHTSLFLWEGTEDSG